MAPQKILLLCSSRFALPSMRDLVGVQQLSAIVIPSYCKDMVQEVQQLMSATGIPVLLVNKENNEAELKKAIKKYGITLVFMMTYSYKITKAVYELPVNGFYNFHSGPLPEYRGADPIFQQIKNKEEHAGVTVHKVDEGMDTGPIVIREMLKLDPTDTYGILNNRLAELAAKLSGMVLKMAGFGIAIPSRPQDGSKARYFKRQTTQEIVVRWSSMDADSIIALANACNPWNKGVVTSINNKIIRLLEMEKLSEKCDAALPPGTVIEMDKDSVTVAVLNDEKLRIIYIYSDEGFLKAGKLSYMGIVVGNCFTDL